MRIDDFYEFLKHEAAAFYDSRSWNELDISAEDWFARFCEYIVLPDEIPDTTREPAPGFE